MEFIYEGLLSITPQQVIMYLVGLLLIYLAIKKEYEPALLLPMGFGAILVNLPLSGVINQTMPGIGEVNGIIEWLFNVGIEASEALPILLFIGIGAMIDFGPLLSQPIMFLFGAAAQFGIFFAICAAALMGFDLKDAASIGIIGAADGPTSILVSQVLGSRYVGPIAVAAYSYMALVPIVQPFAIRLVTTKKERLIRMPAKPSRPVTKTTRILFPIIVTFLVGLISPASVSLVGFLMFGNLLRECGVLGNLSETAQTSLANLITLLLGITISFSMRADAFVRFDTLLIMIIGLLAFVFDTIGGVVFDKVLKLLRKRKNQPYDRGRRYFGLPHVSACGAENGHERGSGQHPHHAGNRRECIRSNRLRYRRRPCYQPCFRLSVIAVGQPVCIQSPVWPAVRGSKT